MKAEFVPIQFWTVNQITIIIQTKYNIYLYTSLQYKIRFPHTLDIDYEMIFWPKNKR